MRLAKVHSCQRQERIARGKADPPAKACRCNKFVSYEEANEMVEAGDALWVIVEVEHGTVNVPCRFCRETEDTKTCEQCHGTGEETKFHAWAKYHPNGDIVLARHASKNASTPRVPTIEAEHIVYAYVNEDPKAAARIEEYGKLTLEARIWPGPSVCKHNPKFTCDRCGLPKGTRINVIGVEPPDNPKTGEGRKYDFGRAI
jgi:hypothetical protein